MARLAAEVPLAAAPLAIPEAPLALVQAYAHNRALCTAGPDVPHLAPGLLRGLGVESDRDAVAHVDGGLLRPGRHDEWWERDVFKFAVNGQTLT